MLVCIIPFTKKKKKRRKKKEVENYPQLHISFITIENAGIFYFSKRKKKKTLNDQIYL